MQCTKIYESITIVKHILDKYENPAQSDLLILFWYLESRIVRVRIVQLDFHGFLSFKIALLLVNCYTCNYINVHRHFIFFIYFQSLFRPGQLRSVDSTRSSVHLKKLRQIVWKQSFAVSLARIVWSSLMLSSLIVMKVMTLKILISVISKHFPGKTLL